MRLFIISVAAILAAGTVKATDATDGGVGVPPCRAHEYGRLLDFWLGDWKVTSMDGTTVFGENHVTMALDGCAIHEDWKGATGARGQSLFFFDARDGAWEQIWVTADTSKPGGLKRKRLVQTGVYGGVIFRGMPVGEDGKHYLDKTTLMPLPEGEVRQLIESSTDNGKTWRTVFDARYSRLY